jgi:predicted nucleic acid-binding protein
MFHVVVLDSGPLGLASSISQKGEAPQLRAWLDKIVLGGTRVVIPEIADYEVRRELLRAGKAIGLARLDRLGSAFDYRPISTTAMRQVAEFWAQARRSGRPTASNVALDADVILAAQAQEAGESGLTCVVATYNVAHISRYVPAMAWHEIH